VPDRYNPIRKKNTMIWLNWVCELVKEGAIGVQFFRNHDLKAIVEDALKFTWP
jgi:hypothetical protein